MRFRLEHPTDPNTVATYGFDHALGFFVDVDIGSKQRSYSAIEPRYDRERPLWGALQFLVESGFFTSEGLQEALLAVERGDPVEPTFDPVVEILANLRTAIDFVA